MSKPNKTQKTDAAVDAFLKAVSPQQKQDDSLALLAMMREITGLEPKMWGKTIIGFGGYHYKYDSGREGDSFRTGFSPRAQNFSIYAMAGYERCGDALSRLGKHKTGKACLYIKRLSDVDVEVLREILVHNFSVMQERYPE